MLGTPLEVPLDGGRLTLGVVRVGDTVRRPSQPSSRFVAQLLALLESRGFRGAPRHLGIDGAGRQITSFLPGSVPERFQRFNGSQVAAAGALLRGLHDATEDSDLARPARVICHHDPGPNNCVFRQGVPCAWIDFDLAAPGDPLEDVAYAAWTWCLSSKPERESVADQAAHVRTLIDGYRLDAPGRDRLVPAILDRQTANVRFWRSFVPGPGQADVPPERIDEIVAWTERERAFVDRHRGSLGGAVCVDY